MVTIGTTRLMSAIEGIGERFGGVLDIDLEVVLFEHRRDDVRAFLRLVAAPAAPDNERLPHRRFLRFHLVSLVQSSSPSASEAGSGAGRGGRLEMAIALPVSDEVWNASITSSA